MKAVCQGIDLSDAVLKVVKACATRTTVPVMECIKISAKNDGITLTATDGEIAIQKKISAEILEEGEVCVPGKYFADFIKKLEGVEIVLSATNKKMEIKYADSQTSMQILSADDFPKVDTDIKDNSFKIKTEDLKNIISATSFCCASDDSRPILKGCQFVISGSALCVTALDGFRLATANTAVLEATADMEFVCPARTLNEIEKMLPDAEEVTEVFIQKGMILVAVESTVLTSRLFGGDFIKKENIIPKSFTTCVTVDKALLKSSIERAAILVRNDRNSLIIMDISQGKVEISSNSDIGNVNEPVKAEVEGKDIKIAMNSKFISEAINALDDEIAELSFNSNVQPFICQNKDKKQVLYLILPVRTANNA
ncbi:MAG: DNA polymerase III subunit beta [Clostridiales bacterium]|nr:DNA polymerase III subunit beta [Clostridiales bacterium]